MPQLVKRTREDLRAQVRALAGPPVNYTPGWRGVDDPTDLGWRLLDDVFLRMMELLIERLNRVPDAHFIRFLDFVGVERAVGGAAVVPVTFHLAKQATQGGDVPARTQVATTQTERSPALVFETQRAFFATPAKLLDVINVIGGADVFSRRKPVDLPPQEADLTSLPTVVLSPTAPGLERLPHELYLGGAKWFGRKEPTTFTVSLTIAGGQASIYNAAHFQWQRYDAQLKDWTSDGVIVSYPAISPSLVTVQFASFPGSAPAEVDGIEDHWLRCRYIGVPSGLALVPHLTGVEAALGGGTETAVAELAFANATPLDLFRPFRPFGERPRGGDAFYLSSSRAFSPAVEQVTIRSTVSPYSTAELQRIFAFITQTVTITTTVRWEYLTSGNTWVPLATRTHTLTAMPNTANPDQPTISNAAQPEPGTFFDAVDVFSAIIAADKPFARGIVNGKEGFWMRAVLASADPYGREGNLNTQTPPRFVGPFFVPPLVTGISIDFTNRTTPEPIALTRSLNAFAVDATTTPFHPFNAPFLSDDPALYVAFEKPFGLGFISLFIQLDDVLSSAQSPREGGKSRVLWEYAAAGGQWMPLDVEDFTADLTESGTVGFLAPADQQERALFPMLVTAEARWWLRARLAAGTYDHPPRLRGIYVNTVFADNRVSEPEALVGSSNGEAGQRFVLVRSPVLAGEVWVREAERPAEGELEDLRVETETLLEREVAVNAADRPEWVQWLQRPNFELSGPRSRHYTLDAVAGVLSFGGVAGRGLIPPLGRDNIVIRDLATGGGERANNDAVPLSVKQLTSSLPFVDKVWNVARAGGGSSPWSLEDTRRFGPFTIKNRGRAVTTEDYESLVLERFSGVGRFRCLATTAPGIGGALVFRPGAVAGIVVPRTGVPMPQPGAALLRRIREYLQTVTLGTIVGEIYVVGPEYTPVAVRATIRAVNVGEASSVARRAGSALQDFFHPLRGGEHGEGWAFGRAVYLSEVYAVLERIEGVDTVLLADFIGPAPLVRANGLVASGTHRIDIA